MAIQITLPPLGESITEATLVAWLKSVGDEVKRGEVLAEIETAKAVMPLECPADGILLAIAVEEGSPVVTRQLLAVIGERGEQWELQGNVPVQKEGAAVLIEPSGHAPAPGGERLRRVTPSARRRAAELGIDIDDVQPAQPGARVTTEDVERHAARQPDTPAAALELPSRRIALNHIRRSLAERMAQSASSIPQFSVSVEADATKLLGWQSELNRKAQADGRLSLTALLIYLAASVLPHHPLINALFDGDGIIVYDTLNIAVGMATPAGLVAPVLRAAEERDLAGIRGWLRQAADAARNGTLLPADFAGATFTISNLGMYGVREFIPLVNPPQSAILAVGAVQPALVPLSDGELLHTHRMMLTVSADHRVLSGDEVALFLVDLRQQIENCGEGG